MRLAPVRHDPLIWPRPWLRSKLELFDVAQDWITPSYTRPLLIRSHSSYTLNAPSLQKDNKRAIICRELSRVTAWHTDYISIPGPGGC